MNRLDPILQATRAEVARRRAATPADELPPRSDSPRPFRDALARPGTLSVIAEHKRRSPSAGSIRDDLTLEQVVTAYERGGAAALSVLTEQPSFGGSLDDLRAARAASSLPVLRKDFIVDRYQVRESAAAGADAILLIVAALTPAELVGLHAEAGDAGLAVLVEVHDGAELDVALDSGAELIGINNRDLTTLEVSHRANVRADPPDSGRQGDRRRVGPALARGARPSGAGRGRRGADRRVADALAGSARRRFGRWSFSFG